MKQSASLIKGTAILTMAGLLVKILGAVYRIFLSRLIGPEGIGLYQMAYPVYLIFLSLSTAGIPIAISKIIAEKATVGDVAGVKGIFKAAFLLLLGMGLFFAIGMAGSASWIATHLVADERAVYAIWALAPAIFFMNIMAVFRGFFQGWLEMKPSAVSQIFEQITRVAVSVILAMMFLKNGVEHAAAGAAFGATAGGAAGLCYLVITYYKKRNCFKINQSKKGYGNLGKNIQKLIKFALPISITVILMPILQTLDSIIVPNMLQKIGYTIRQSTTMLGVLGNSWAVIYLPLIVTTAISTYMVPTVASLRNSFGNSLIKEKVTEGLRLALIYLIPATVGLAVFGETVYRLIYGQSGVELLTWFAPAVFFMGLEQVSAGILQGLGRPKWPLVNFTLGAIVKIGITISATGWPGFNLAGAALGTVLGAGITALSNLFVIKKIIHYQLPFKFKLLISGLMMLIFCCLAKRELHLGYLIEFFGIGVFGVGLYLVTLWIVKGIIPRDLEMIRELFKKKEPA